MYIHEDNKLAYNKFAGRLKGRNTDIFYLLSKAKVQPHLQASLSRFHVMTYIFWGYFPDLCSKYMYFNGA